MRLISLMARLLTAGGKRSETLVYTPMWGL